MSEESLLSSWNAAMIAANASRLSPEAKDLLIQELRRRAAAVQAHFNQLEQMVAQAKAEGMPDDLSGPLGEAREASMLIVRTLAEAERLVRRTELLRAAERTQRFNDGSPSPEDQSGQN